MSDTKPVFDLEKVYDEQISPLMVKIIEICKEHKMPMIFSAMYVRSEEGEEGLCTTSLLYPEREPPKKMVEAHQTLIGQRPIPMFRTTLVKEDGSRETTLTAFLDDG